jgi:hypothetical protein
VQRAAYVKGVLEGEVLGWKMHAGVRKWPCQVNFRWKRVCILIDISSDVDVFL